MKGHISETQLKLLRRIAEVGARGVFVPTPKTQADKTVRALHRRGLVEITGQYMWNGLEALPVRCTHKGFTTLTDFGL